MDIMRLTKFNKRDRDQDQDQDQNQAIRSGGVLPSVSGSLIGFEILAQELDLSEVTSVVAQGPGVGLESHDVSDIPILFL